MDTANSYNVDKNTWSQHIGDLFVYLDKSSVNEGILGITVKKTWVRKMIDLISFIYHKWHGTKA